MIEDWLKGIVVWVQENWRDFCLFAMAIAAAILVLLVP